MTASDPKDTKGGDSVIIVESPAKTKTISRILGPGYRVMATMGHVRDLPKNRLGVDVEKDFRLEYSLIPSRRKVVEQLRRAVKDASLVYLAPDPDREGEAIAWHVAQVLGLPDEKLARITFNEITPNAVRRAVSDPGPIDMNLVEAQQARRILDRLVGYKLSPLLWKKISRGLSAGRVQSVAVRLIVEREEEIRRFEPEEYWKLVAKLSKTDGSATFDAELLKIGGKKAVVRDGETAHALRERLSASPWRVLSVTKKTSYGKPYPPFNTASLQQAAASRLGFSAKRTMRVAQQLYEGVEMGDRGSIGLITYMRTDSYRVSASSIEQVRSFIEGEYGRDYLPAKPRILSAKKGAQDAHEAIRPTDVFLTPEKVKPWLGRDQFRLYKLIWHQFVASQMKPARFEVVTADIEAADAVFRASGKRLLFDGHLRASWGGEKDSSSLLPPLSEGEPLDLVELAASQHFTQPPPRYTEATLVKTLEKEGIGRPSTYAAIISTIQQRGYVKLEEKKFVPTELGELVTKKLVEHFPDILDVSFTRSMEERLDRIEEGEARWLDVVRDFYERFSRALEKAAAEMTSERGKPAESGETCPECGAPLVERISRYGRFLACSAYPKCKYVKRDESRPAPQATGEKCPECGGELVVRRGRRGPFIACSNYPDCKYTRDIAGASDPVLGKTVEEVRCPKCGAPMVVRRSRRGYFLGCSAYPKCKGIAKVPPGLIERLKAEAAAESPAEGEGSGD